MAPYLKVYKAVEQLSSLRSVPMPLPDSSKADNGFIRLIGCSRFLGVLHIWNCPSVAASLAAHWRVPHTYVTLPKDKRGFANLNYLQKETIYRDEKRKESPKMKLLENSKLDGISAALCMDTGDCKITGRWVSLHWYSRSVILGWVIDDIHRTFRV